MKAILLILGLTLATTYSSIISTKPERKLADTEFLTRHKKVLELFIGLGHTDNFHTEHNELQTNPANFVKPEVLKDFLTAYHHGFLPVDAVFSSFCHHTRMDTIKLFNLFYFAKDFDTFYSVASWARKHLNPIQFARAYYTALVHREDCQYFTIPPMYEVIPNYFLPADTLHEIYDAKLLGIKERRFTYNNTGYEYNYHEYMYGGPLSPDALGHLDYKVSYLREDVGVNAWYLLSTIRFPSWMPSEKYRGTVWYRVGESLYYQHSLIFSRYILGRIANGLPYVKRLDWDSPIYVGYNPRMLHINGEPFAVRPDNIIPSKLNKLPVLKTKVLERRILDTIDVEAYWEMSNSTLVSVRNNDGIEILSRIMFGFHNRPNKNYYGSYFYRAMEALGFVSRTGSDRKYVGGAVTTPLTAMRDPAFYQFLARMLTYFQIHKKKLPRYTNEDLTFTGVKVKDFEVDKFITYFEKFEFEVTNAVPFADRAEMKDYKYYAKQFRLNHKPYNYKLSVMSDVAKDAMIRVYIGPKFDSEERELTIDQRRLAYFEIDRFPATLTVGENILERNSKESPLFSPDPEGFRSLSSRIKNALKNVEQFYYAEKSSCGVPSRLQLPRGWKNGQPFTIAVVVTPFEQVYTGDEKKFYAPCGGSKLYDSKPFGFPFDRPLEDIEFHGIPNILFKDVLIYHKDESEVNRAT